MEIITSIESYLTWLRTCEVEEKQGEPSLSWQQHHLYFRGQANCEWKLVPSVFVNKDNEYELLHDAYRHAWKYLQDYPTDLEKMVVLQHYGLHTRLLDLTSNPLIALYFACSGYDDMDGKVFCYYASGAEGVSMPQIIAKVVANGINQGLGLDQFLKNEYQSYYIREPNSPIDLENFKKWKEELYKPQFFLSPFNNERITAQRGAFIMAPLNKNDSGTGAHFDEGSIEKHRICKVVLLDKSMKKSLLDELSLLGIDESTIYPDLEHLLKFLNKSNT